MLCSKAIIEVTYPELCFITVQMFGYFSKMPQPLNSQGYNSHRLFLDNFLGLFIPLKVIFGLIPFVDLACTSYFTHLHL